MKFIEVEYNEDFKPLETVLAGVTRPGDFFVSGVMEIPMPKIEVQDVGMLSFPVPDTQIAALVRQSERAPYGRGEKTIVDTSVRNVWQIGSARVRIGGKSWAANFETMLSKVSAGLGCESITTSAKLYKLLLYDRDGFFLPHRDTEKSDGMFATLVVTLPSAHRGGELRIRHAGREVTVDTNSAEPSELSYVAFYADCEHEALPVREGNRVCLVYSLLQKNGKRSRTLRAPEYQSQIEEAAAILDRCLRTSAVPTKIAWLLEHQYSPAGLSFSALKGADAAKVGVLVEAAKRAQCAAHLGIVHIGESGAAEPDYDGHLYRSRWNRYRDDEDDDVDEPDVEDDEDTSFTAVTVDDSWQYVDEWRNVNDGIVEFGQIPLADGELLPQGALDEEPPDKKRLTEASGNEGASYERSYHRAALVLWPNDRYADVLLEAGVAAALPYLKELIGGEDYGAEALALAKRMVEMWEGDSRGRDYYSFVRNRPEASHRTEMIGALQKLSAVSLLEHFITTTIDRSYDGSENPALVSSVGVLGNAGATVVLSALISSQVPYRPHECVELLLALTEDASRCFQEVAESAIAGLDRIGIRDSKSEEDDWDSQERRRPLSYQFLVNLLEALRRFKKASLCEAAAEKIADRPKIFSPVTLVVPALEEIYVEWGRKAAASESSLTHLWMKSTEFLLGRSETPPLPPSDWHLNVKLNCSCPDCSELQMFARDPVERVHRFRIKKERRQHLHNTIDRHRLDMTHVTERVGSPQTLVCTKDRRSFDRRMTEYEREIAAMHTLIDLTPDSKATTALSARMKAAVVTSGRK